jgi:hypothetical protein
VISSRQTGGLSWHTWGFLATGPVQPARNPVAAPVGDRPRCRSARAIPTSRSVPAQPSADHGSARHLGLGSVVSSVKASPPAAMGRHRPAKQNQSSPTFVNFHFVFGDFVPVNSKKCDAGTRHRPTGNRLPSERKLMTEDLWTGRAEIPTVTARTRLSRLQGGG